jgi:hypothetical protein
VILVLDSQEEVGSPQPEGFVAADYAFNSYGESQTGYRTMMLQQPRIASPRSGCAQRRAIRIPASSEALRSTLRMCWWRSWRRW